jgi:cytochrome c553
MRKIVLLITVCLAAGALAARSADAKENWEKQCQKCHGVDGKGETAMGKKLKVKDYTDAKVQASMKDEEILKNIKEGKKEGDKTLMKAYAEVLSEAEIKDLVAYVRKLKK